MTDGNFASSPFSILADRRSAECWAGRPDVREQLRRLVRSWSVNPSSTLDLVWANFGAGKTHTLYHIQHLLTADGDNAAKAIPVVVELPEGTAKFVGFYRILAAEMPWPTLAKNLLESRLTEYPPLEVALRALKYGDHHAQQLAQAWLYARKPHLTQLKSLGIQERIETDETALAVLRAVAQGLSGCDHRLVLLLDEFQRVGLTAVRTRSTVLPYLRSVFSQCPTHFSLVIAIKSRLEDTAMQLLPDELRTLLGIRPTIGLAPFSRQDAMDFIVQRFDYFRPPGEEGDRLAPFSQDAVDATLDWLEHDDRDGFGPREVLQALGAIFEQAAVDGTVAIHRELVEKTLGPLTDRP